MDNVINRIIILYGEMYTSSRFKILNQIMNIERVNQTEDYLA